MNRPGRPICLLAIARAMLVALAVLTSTAMAADRPSWWDGAASEAKAEGYGLITAEELNDLSDTNPDLLILDVRPDYEYRAGHLPGAVNLEFDLGDRLELKPDKRAAVKKLLGPDRNRPIVIYCRSFR